MIALKEAFVLFLANLAIFFILVTFLTRLIRIETLLVPNLKSKLIYSAFFILMAFIVMQFPLTTEAGNRIDLRGVAVIVAGIFGGPLGGITVGASAGLYRFVLGGTGSEIGLLSCLIEGLIAGLYSKYLLKNKLLQFNPLMVAIPVIVSIAAHIQLILLFDNTNHLWSYRLFHFGLLLIGSLVLTVLVQDALRVSEKTASLRRDLVTDKVTNVYNIKFLDTYLNENLALAEKAGTKLSVVFLDLDFFKTINDKYGHQKGDEILFKVAQTIRKSLRPSDVVGRYGGDEFLVILPGCDTHGAMAIGRRIMDNIELLQEREKLAKEISVSMGIATYPDHGENSEVLIKHADNALYTAKNSGRNKLVTAS